MNDKDKNCRKLGNDAGQGDDRENEAHILVMSTQHWPGSPLMIKWKNISLL